MRKRLRQGILIMMIAVLALSGCRKKADDTQAETTAASANAAFGASQAYDEGRRAMSSDDFETAVDSFEKSITLDPSNPDAYQGLFDAWYALEDYEMADDALVRGIAATDDDGLKETRLESLATFGEYALEQEDFESAVGWYEKLTEAGGATQETTIALSSAYSGMEEYEKAVEILEGADQNNEEVKAAMIATRTQAGELFFEEGSYDEAAKQLTEVIRLDPDAIDAYSILGSVYIESNRMSEADAIVKDGQNRFMKADSSVTDEQLDSFLNMASEYYMTLENVSACLQFWEQAVALRPNNESYKNELSNYRSIAADEAYVKAEELLESGDTSGASAQYKLAFAYAPSNYEAGLVFAGDYTYCLNSDGSWKTGWYTDEVGARYYFDPGSARAATGIKQIDGSLYYFEDDGIMVTEDSVPDGYYAGPDGKLTKGEPPTEEETEEETEPEETDEETEPEETVPAETGVSSAEAEGPGAADAQNTVKPTEPAATRETASKSDTKTKTPSQKETVSKPTIAVDFKLNADTLKDAKDQGGVVSVAGSDLFTDLDGSLSMEAVEACIMKYGTDYEWLEDTDPFEIRMGDMVIGIVPGDEWTSQPLVIERGASYRDALHKKVLPDDVEFTVEFNSYYGKALDLDSIEKKNAK